MFESFLGSLLPIFFLVLGVLIFIKFNNDIELLKERLQKLEEPNKIIPQELQAITQIKEEIIEEETIATETEEEVLETDWVDNFLDWLQKDWLLKIGAILLILALGWLTSYAFINNWITPQIRIVMGIVFGFIMLATGYLRFKLAPNQGITLTILGVTIINGTLYSATTIFQLINPAICLLIVLFTTTIAYAISQKHQQKILAWLTFLISATAPIFTGSFRSDTSLTLMFLIAMSLGLIWLSIKNNWPSIQLIILLISTIYGFLFDYNDNITTTTIYIGLITTIIFASNLIGILKQKPNQEFNLELATLFANTIFAVIFISFILDISNPIYLGLIALIYAVTGLTLHQVSSEKNKVFTITYLSLSAAIIAIIASIKLSGLSLFYFFLLEVLVVYISLRSHQFTSQKANQYLLLYAIPLVMLLPHLTNFIIGDKNFWAQILAALILIGSAYLVSTEKTPNENTKTIKGILIIGSTLFIYNSYWFSLKQLLSNFNQLYVLIALITFTLIGLGTYIYGLFTKSNFARIYGLSLIGFVIARLVIIDLWTMPILTRIIVFFSIGLLLLLSTFIANHKKITDKTIDNSTNQQL